DPVVEAAGARADGSRTETGLVTTPTAERVRRSAISLAGRISIGGKGIGEAPTVGGWGTEKGGATAPVEAVTTIEGSLTRFNEPVTTRTSPPPSADKSVRMVASRLATVVRSVDVTLESWIAVTKSENVWSITFDETLDPAKSAANSLSETGLADPPTTAVA